MRGLLVQKMTIISEIASYISVTLFSLSAIIQIGVALGIVPLNILWGGSQHELTLQLRAASIIAAVILIAFAWIIRQRTNDPSNGCIRNLCRCITLYMALNSVGNFMSTNTFEKYVDGTVTVILTISTGLVGSGLNMDRRENYITIDDR